jgi:hypothetical protein
MDIDIQEALRAVRKAVETRKARDSGAKTEPEALRDLDETVCLTSRSLYMRFLSTALWCRSVDETTLKAVREALQGAVACLPLHDYPPASKSDYKVRKSVVKRLKEFQKIAQNTVRDERRQGWLVIPVPKGEDLLQPA